VTVSGLYSVDDGIINEYGSVGGMRICKGHQNLDGFQRNTWRYITITVAAWSKAWTVLARSNAGIVISNPTQGMDVCVRLFYVCVVPCVGSGLATD
jgi:hypothetical protein